MVTRCQNLVSWKQQYVDVWPEGEVGDLSARGAVSWGTGHPHVSPQEPEEAGCPGPVSRVLGREGSWEGVLSMPSTGRHAENSRAM